MTTEQQRENWKRLAQEYIDRRFKGVKPTLNQLTAPCPLQQSYQPTPNNYRNITQNRHAPTASRNRRAALAAVERRETYIDPMGAGWFLHS